MNSVNSKNLTYMVMLMALLAVIFIYALIFNHNQDVIRTDLNGISIED